MIQNEHASLARTDTYIHGSWQQEQTTKIRQAWRALNMNIASKECKIVTVRGRSGVRDRAKAFGL